MYQAPDYKFGGNAGESHCQGTGSKGERRNVGGLLPCSPAVLVGATCLYLGSQLLPKGSSARATVLLGLKKPFPCLPLQAQSANCCPWCFSSPLCSPIWPRTQDSMNTSCLFAQLSLIIPLSAPSASQWVPGWYNVCEPSKWCCSSFRGTVGTRAGREGPAFSRNIKIYNRNLSSTKTI